MSYLQDEPSAEKLGVGATWDYSTRLGPDNPLTANEISCARNLKFTNPNNEPFTVTFNVIGNLPPGSSSSITAGSSTDSSTSTGGDSSSSGGKSSGTFANVTGGVMTSVYKLVYNPLLNTVTIELIKREELLCGIYCLRVSQTFLSVVLGIQETQLKG